MKSLMALKQLRKKEYKKSVDLLNEPGNNSLWTQMMVTTDAAEGPRPKVTLSQKDAIRLLYELSKPEKDREKQAENYYKMGSVYYFSPYLSRADDVWDGRMWVSLNYSFGPDTWMLSYVLPSKDIKARIDDFYENEYNNKNTAMEYFEKAATLTNNRELKAKCALMQILQNNWQNRRYDWMIYNQQSLNAQSQEFKDMAKKIVDEKQKSLDAFKTEYSGTEYYKRYRNWCGNFVNEPVVFTQ
jgi:hypothetical protein